MGKSNLQGILDAHHVSQRDLAQMIGVCTSTVSTWCCGARPLPLERAAQIVEALDLDPGELETGRRKAIAVHLPKTVEVIRCKDCRYFVPSTSVCVVFNYHPVIKADYCSYGRHRDDAAEAKAATEIVRRQMGRH